MLHDLPIDRYRVRLRLTAPARFRFQHGGAVRGLLSQTLARHELPEGLIPYAPESGKISFRAGDPYHLGITLAGDDRRWAEHLFAGLTRVGRTPPDGSPPTLGGNFEVESVDPLPPLDVATTEDGLHDGDELTLRFVSPLRLRRPDALQRRGAAYLNDRCFPLDHFLARLWARSVLLAHGRYPEGEEWGEAPAPPEPVDVDPGNLVWLDVPVTGGRHKNRSYTLGGVQGSVVLGGLPGRLRPLLLTGSELHAGASTGYGLGRYLVENGHPVAHPVQPARTLLERAATVSRLRAALDRELASPSRDETKQADVDPIGLARELATGRYRPAPLDLRLAVGEGGDLTSPAVPCLRDRVAQRAVADVLRESADALLEDCSWAYRRGYSRAGAEKARCRAEREGFGDAEPVELGELGRLVAHERLLATLEALFPLDPVVELIRAWVTAPVRCGDQVVARRRGLPQGSELSGVLVRFVLEHVDNELGDAERVLRGAGDEWLCLRRS